MNKIICNAMLVCMGINVGTALLGMFAGSVELLLISTVSFASCYIGYTLRKGKEDV